MQVQAKEFVKGYSNSNKSRGIVESKVFTAPDTKSYGSYSVKIDSSSTSSSTSSGIASGGACSSSPSPSPNKVIVPTHVYIENAKFY